MNSYVRRYIVHAVTLIFAALCFFQVEAVDAAPAAPVPSVYTQPTGTVIYAQKQGDDIFNWIAAQDGAVIVQHKDGFWYYAEIRGNRLVAGPVKYAIQQHPARIVTSDDMAPLHRYYSERRKLSTMDGDRPSKSVGISGGEVRTTQDLSKPHPMLVVLVNFQNASLSTTESQWQQLVFGSTGKTVNQYYKENSGRRFYFTPAQETGGTSNDGVVTVTLDQNHPNTAGNPNDTNRMLVASALSAADAQVNFTDYDTDRNGYISAQELHIVTIIAGQEAAYRDSSFSGSAPSVWGHHWALSDSSSPTIDGVKLLSADGGGGYTQFGELQGGHQATIGIIVHELGHDLDLPDLYDVDPNNEDTNGVGGFSVMGGGSWAHAANEYAGTTPVHLDAWSKLFLGFAAPVEIPYGTDISATVHAVDTANPDAYQMYKVKTGSPDEYFLIENRQQGSNSGFDQGLSSYTTGSGIAIWHIDLSVIRNHYDAVNDRNPKGIDLESFDTSPDDPFYHDGYTFDRYHQPGSSTHNGTSSAVSIIAPSPSSYSMPFKAGTGPGMTTDAAAFSAAGSFTYTSQWNEAAVLYYEVLPAGSSEPSASRIIQGQDSAGNPVALSGRESVAKGKPGTITLGGLAASTGYDFYVIAVDAYGHLGGSDIRHFTTALYPVISQPATLPTVLGTVTPPVMPFVPPTPPAADNPPTVPGVKSNGHVGVTIEHLMPETAKDANGKITELWKVDAGLLGRAFESLEAQPDAVRKIEVPVTLTADQPASVEFPADVLADRSLDSSDTILSVTSEGASYQLPVGVLELKAIARRLGADLQDTKVYVGFEQISGTAANPINAAAAASEYKILGAPVDFSVTVTGNGKTEELKDFGRTYVVRTLVLNQIVNPTTTSVVVYDPQTEKLSFVPATFSSVDGKTIVTVQRSGNSLYTIVQSDKSFWDIRSHWARQDIELLASKTLVKGMTATTFGPNRSVTRAQFAALLAQALGLSETKTAAHFPDVKASDWHSGYVGADVKAGLVHGYADGSFRPNERITREQMAAMIDSAARFAGKPLTDQADRTHLSVYKDRSVISSYAKDAVANVVKTGMMQGVKRDEFRPSDFATRAQSASILKRLLLHLHFIN